MMRRRASGVLHDVLVRHALVCRGGDVLNDLMGERCGPAEVAASYGEGSGTMAVGSGCSQNCNLTARVRVFELSLRESVLNVGEL